MKKKTFKLSYYTLIILLSISILPLFLNADSSEWCTELVGVWTLIGYIIRTLYVLAPLLFIVTGSITLLKALTEKDESAIKKAQKLLVKKIIAAVAVFLVLTVTQIVIGVVADKGWEQCAECVLHPNNSNCGISSNK